MTVYKESDCASPSNEALREFQVIDIFYQQADWITYPFTPVSTFILLYEKFLQFDWLRAVVFQLNLKYLHVKITVSMVTKITKQIQKQWRKDFQIFKLKRFKN